MEPEVRGHGRGHALLAGPGVDGFRVDVAHKMAHDPELLDNPLVELSEEDLGKSQEARPAGGPS